MKIIMSKDKTVAMLISDQQWVIMSISRAEDDNHKFIGWSVGIGPCRMALVQDENEAKRLLEQTVAFLADKTLTLE